MDNWHCVAEPVFGHTRASGRQLAAIGVIHLSGIYPPKFGSSSPNRAGLVDADKLVGVPQSISRFEAITAVVAAFSLVLRESGSFHASYR